MGPQIGVTWMALARGFQNDGTIAISPKNEASMLKSLKLGKSKDFSKQVFLDHPNQTQLLVNVPEFKIIYFYGGIGTKVPIAL